MSGGSGLLIHPWLKIGRDERGKITEAINLLEKLGTIGNDHPYFGEWLDVELVDE